MILDSPTFYLIYLILRNQMLKNHYPYTLDWQLVANEYHFLFF